MGFPDPIWRAPDPEGLSRACGCGYERVGPYGYPFRTCSHCGSIHPEDLVAALNNGATLGGSDWKYGWPHKFYVENIANPLAGQLVDSSGGSHSIDHEPTTDEIQAEKARFASGYKPEYVQQMVANVRAPGWCPGMPANAFWNICIHVKSPAPEHTTAKFYNQHLEDDGYDSEARTKILEILTERSGIAWFIADNGKLHYRAPHFGYQQ